jgi:hypothetical protein
VAGRRRLVLDEEIVALSGARPDFTLLQRRMRSGPPGAGLLAAVPVTLIIFDVLRSGRDHDAVTNLASRAASHASLDDPRAITHLLEALREAEADDAFATLLARDPASHASHASLGAWAVTSLLRELRAAGARDAVTTLANRAADAGMFDLFLEFCPDEASSYLLGREPDGTASQPWRWQEPGQLGPQSANKAGRDS